MFELDLDASICKLYLVHSTLSYHGILMQTFHESLVAAGAGITLVDSVVMSRPGMSVSYDYSYMLYFICCTETISFLFLTLLNVHNCAEVGRSRF